MQTDFLGPSQLMASQLDNVLQASTQAAANERAATADRQLKMQEMAKNFEVKSNLSHALMATDPVAALDMMNDGLKGFGAALTMDQFRPAMKGFEVMADLTRNGDHQGAMGVLKSMKERGWLVNLQDQQRAAQMEQQARESVSQQQAQAVTDLQPENPQLTRAKEFTSLVAQAGGMGNVNPDELVRLTGTTDPTAQENRLRLDDAIVQGHQARQQAMARLFSLDPAAFGKSADVMAAQIANPESMAKMRIAELLTQPERTPEQERELQGKASVYAPNLSDALNIKSAQRDKERLQNQLEDTRTRQSALSDHLDLDGQATAAISQLSNATEGLPDPNKPLSDEAAKQHLLAEGTRTVQGQTYAIQAQQRIATLEQTAQAADQQRERLASLAVSALPGQRDSIERQMNEYGSMAKSNRAMARLLKDENPYAIAAKESDLSLNPSEQGTVDLKSLKADRDKDLAIVQAEQDRLQRREAILQGQQPAAERKEEQERQMRMAHQSVDAAVAKGKPLTASIREAAEQFGVDKAELAKSVMTARGAGLWEAQNVFAMLPTAQQTSQEAGKIAQRYGVSAQDVFKGITNPNKPLVQIGQEKAEAKKVGEGFGDQYVAIQQSDLSSAGKLAKLDRMEQLLTGVHTGALVPSITQIQAIGQSFGLEVDKTLPAKQALQALSNEIALQLRNPTGGAGMPGSLSNQDREFLISMTPGLSQTPEGNRLIIDTARKLEKRNQEVARMARAYRKKNGQFDEGFFDNLQTYANAHPLFTPPDLSQYQEVRTTKDGRRLGKKADGSIMEIR